VLWRFIANHRNALRRLAIITVLHGDAFNISSQVLVSRRNRGVAPVVRGWRQSLSNKKPDAALGWQVIAVLIALIVCGRSAVEEQWLGLAVGVVAVVFEVRSIRRSTLESRCQ